MSKKIRTGIILSFLLTLFVPTQIVSADVGPKPSMSFGFEQGSSDPSVTIISGTLFECEQSDCQDAEPLEQVGPQEFWCSETSCSALAYGFKTYHRLEIQFSDGKTRQSNIFETIQFNSSYKVTIRQNDLLVEPVPSVNWFSPATYLVLCACCLVGVAIPITVIVLIVVRVARNK
ncbi:MAG: hypothetical protein ABIF04_05960 [Chloroflexota bacterium]